MAAPASCALVIQALVPLIIQSSPSLVAVVEAAPASLPLPGSLRPKQPILSAPPSSAMHVAYGVTPSDERIDFLHLEVSECSLELA